MHLAKFKTCLAAIALACSASAAFAAEMSPFGELLPAESVYRLHAPYEVRFGAFAHEPGGIEKGTTDITGEVIFGGVGKSTSWDFSQVRLHVGGNANVGGKTNGAYWGFVFTGYIYDKWFIEGSMDGAWNDGFTGPVKPAPIYKRAGTGCHFSWHESFSIGYNVTEHWSVMATAEHYSNLQLCDRNHGLSNYGVRLGYAF
jgi:lipid A 3-O-deacylase